MFAELEEKVSKEEFATQMTKAMSTKVISQCCLFRFCPMRQGPEVISFTKTMMFFVHATAPNRREVRFLGLDALKATTYLRTVTCSIVTNRN